MKAPLFWNMTPPTACAKMLAPLGRVYAAIVRKRLKRADAVTSVLPVICVGNVTMGGSGKTPVVQALVHLLQTGGKNPAILLRGYGGSNRKPLWVHKQDAATVGDEALQHAMVAPTFVSRNRAVGAKQIELNKAITHIVMDDGLQNAQLKKNLSFMVIDGEQPFGNECMFPAGPLREPVEEALKRVQAIIVTGEDNFNLAARFQFLMPVFRATAQLMNPEIFAGKPVIAFAGIGRPQKFFDSLRRCDAVLVREISFGDHHPYTDAEIKKILTDADKVKAMVVTTRKDWVRLPADMQNRVVAMDAELVWNNEAALVDFLKQKGML